MEGRVIPFYCQDCDIDFQTVANRRYKNSYVGDVWYTKCPKCGDRLIRLQNEKAKIDPYFRLSTKMKADRRRFHKDLVQPGHADFDKLYPEHKKKREKEKELQEKHNWKQKHEKGI